jgi:hypothetical protein
MIRIRLNVEKKLAHPCDLKKTDTEPTSKKSCKHVSDIERGEKNSLHGARIGTDWRFYK